MLNNSCLLALRWPKLGSDGPACMENTGCSLAEASAKNYYYSFFKLGIRVVSCKKIKRTKVDFMYSRYNLCVMGTSADSLSLPAGKLVPHVASN